MSARETKRAPPIPPQDILYTAKRVAGLQRQVEMYAEENQLRFTPYSTYYGSFFLLRVPVTINEQAAVIEYSQSGELTINSRDPKHGFPLSSVSADLKAILKENGVTDVGHLFCEEAPLYQVTFSSEDSLRKFLSSMPKVQDDLGSLFSAKLTESQTSSLPTHCSQPLLTTVGTELFLITPNMVTRDASMDHVTLDNCSTCMTLWKESRLFDFDSLFRVYRVDPSKLPQRGMANMHSHTFSCIMLINNLCVIHSCLFVNTCKLTNLY